MATAAAEGLRERKKRQTREAIGAAAMRLFGERGFDAVTVDEVAEAAGVSKKTVFNYFPSKEDLVFRAGEERRAALIAAILERPPGTSLVLPFRRLTAAWLDRIEADPVEVTVAVPRLVMGSATLRNGLFLGWEREAAALAPVLAAEAGEPADAVAPAVVARSLAWTHRVVFRQAFARLLAGEDRAAVAAALREEADRAYDLLEQGLGGYGGKRAVGSHRPASQERTTP
jgi:AcrR family transcriptional regulator